MILKKLSPLISLLFIFVNIQINSMEEKNSVELDEQIISYIEKLPNELLLLIFYSKIDNIINNNNSAEAKREFKIFLSSICLTKKRFLAFKKDLEEYFDKNKIEVTDMLINTSNKPYSMDFSVGGTEYSTTVGNDQEQTKFAQNISKLDDSVLTQIGQAIVSSIRGNTEQKDSILETIFDTLLYGPYLRVKELKVQNLKDKQAMEKIRILVKTISDAYSNKTKTIYINSLKQYKIAP